MQVNWHVDQSFNERSATAGPCFIQSRHSCGKRSVLSQPFVRIPRTCVSSNCWRFWLKPPRPPSVSYVALLRLDQHTNTFLLLPQSVLPLHINALCFFLQQTITPTKRLAVCMSVRSIAGLHANTFKEIYTTLDRKCQKLLMAAAILGDGTSTARSAKVTESAPSIELKAFG